MRNVSDAQTIAEDVRVRLDPVAASGQSQQRTPPDAQTQGVQERAETLHENLQAVSARSLGRRSEVAGMLARSTHQDRDGEHQPGGREGDHEHPAAMSDAAVRAAHMPSGPLKVKARLKTMLQRQRTSV